MIEIYCSFVRKRL